MADCFSLNAFKSVAIDNMGYRYVDPAAIHQGILIGTAFVGRAGIPMLDSRTTRLGVAKY